MNRIITFLLLVVFSVSLNAQHVGIQAVFSTASNSYIDFGVTRNVSKYAAISSVSKFTFALWVKWESKTALGVSDNATILAMADSTGSSNNGTLWIQHNSNNTKFEFGLKLLKNGNFTKISLQSKTNPVDGVWYHLACVYDGSAMKFYINGVLENTSIISGTIPLMSTKGKFILGRSPNSNNSYRKFNGTIDEFGMWSSALTQKDIIAFKNNPDSVAFSAAKATGMIGYYNFENAAVEDFSPSPNNGITGSGVVFLASDAATLPVQLIEFTAQSTGDLVTLNWSTANELNNDYFIIEKTIDGINLETIGKIKGAGNSNILLNYQFNDLNTINGTVYYRLTQVDFDGKKTSSAFVGINSNPIKRSNSIYPNPLKSGSILNFQSSDNAPKSIIIYSSNGIKIVERLEVSELNLRIPTDGLQTGMYLVRIIEGAEIQTIKLQVL